MFYSTRQILNHPEITKKLGVEAGLKGKSFIVQGFGNVGYWASKFFVEEGAKLVGVAEFDGSIYNPEGISPQELFEYKRRSVTKGVKGYPGSKSYENDEAIYQEAYFRSYVEISSFRLHLRNRLTRITLRGFRLSLSWRLRMVQQLCKLSRFC